MSQSKSSVLLLAGDLITTTTDETKEASSRKGCYVKEDKVFASVAQRRRDGDSEQLQCRCYEHPKIGDTVFCKVTKVTHARQCYLDVLHPKDWTHFKASTSIVPELPMPMTDAVIKARITSLHMGSRNLLQVNLG